MHIKLIIYWISLYRIRISVASAQDPYNCMAFKYNICSTSVLPIFMQVAAKGVPHSVSLLILASFVTNANFNLVVTNNIGYTTFFYKRLNCHMSIYDFKTMVPFLICQTLIVVILATSTVKSPSL